MQGNVTGQKPEIQNPVTVDYAWLEANGVFHARRQLSMLPRQTNQPYVSATRGRPLS